MRHPGTPSGWLPSAGCVRPSAPRVAVALLTVSVLAGCGDDDSGDGSNTEPVVVDFTFADGEIDPQGEEIDATVGQPIELHVDSDTADEIHVHSEPEHEFEVEADPGTNQVFRFSVDIPGQVEVESHETETTIVRLVVTP